MMLCPNPKNPPVTIATSIAPNADIQNQQQAIQSWLTQGFKIISINTSEEIAQLNSYFPNIEFVAAKRDARAKYGKPYIYFDDLLECLKDAGSATGGIVNSDIHLLQPGLHDFIAKEACNSFVFGARMDVQSLDALETASRYQGFDYFFFDKTVIEKYPKEEFCIGLPWWDYWAVLIPLASGIPVKKLVTPVAYHVIHRPGNLDTQSWIPLGHCLAKYAQPPFELTPETMANYQPALFQILDTKATEITYRPNHIPISVIVHTLNEEQNIRNCLECVKWADEIVVIDMYSEDRTIEIAKQYTDKIFFHERCRYVEPARQFALSQVSHEWVLVVDADELVPLALRDILRSLADSERCDVVLIPRANYLFGHLMQGSGRSADQDCQLRFFKKSFIHYTTQIHQFPLVLKNARLHHLSGYQQALVHFNYIDIEQFIDKLNRYTTIEAESDYAAGKRFNLEESWHNSISQINKIALDKEGWQKDGAIGFGLGVLMAMYHFSAALKLKMIEDTNSLSPYETINKQYQAIAADIIKEYSK